MDENEQAQPTNEIFGSPLLNGWVREIEARGEQPQLLSFSRWAQDNVDEVIATYPEFKGFHVPGFFKGKVYRSDTPPSALTVPRSDAPETCACAGVATATASAVAALLHASAAASVRARDWRAELF